MTTDHGERQERVTSFGSIRLVFTGMVITIAVLLLLHLSGLIYSFLIAPAQVFTFVPGEGRVYLPGPASSIVRFVDFDTEANLPTWFNSGQLLACAVALAITAAAVPHSTHRRTSPLHWWALAAIFGFLSVDELASVHERLIGPLRRAFNFGGILYFSWVVVAGILVLVFILAFLRFWWQLPVRWRWLFFLSGAIYVGGALGMEMVGGWYSDTYGEDNPGYVAITTAEELLEMSGATVFLYAILIFLRDELGVRLTLLD